MSTMQISVDKDKISSLGWIYYKQPKNTTYRQVFIRQYWKHCPDLSWGSSIGLSDGEVCPPPNYTSGAHLPL